MEKILAYPVCITPASTFDEKDTGYVVTFTDFPEAITQGDTLEEAYEMARDCLEEAMASRSKMTN